MKKVFVLAAFTFAVGSSMAQSQAKYAVSGTYEDGKTVYLLDQLTDKVIDSTVVADGKFSFTGTFAATSSPRFPDLRQDNEPKTQQ